MCVCTEVSVTCHLLFPCKHTEYKQFFHAMSFNLLHWYKNICHHHLSPVSYCFPGYKISRLWPVTCHLSIFSFCLTEDCHLSPVNFGFSIWQKTLTEEGPTFLASASTLEQDYCHHGSSFMVQTSVDERDNWEVDRREQLQTCNNKSRDQTSWVTWPCMNLSSEQATDTKKNQNGPTQNCYVTWPRCWKKPRLRIIFRNSPQLHPLRLKFSKVLALPKEICITNGRATSQHLDVQNEFAI